VGPRAGMGAVERRKKILPLPGVERRSSSRHSTRLNISGGSFDNVGEGAGVACVTNILVTGVEITDPQDIYHLMYSGNNMYRLLSY
jgi:hypothetical protein